ncbi:hypothetical protein PTTG_00736 [Puccinia triticina 1-1 BBBD Race 1]|uniref:PX domain-containing protein n=1 Tax=Puccinia triticina (isolate 1-1 / race 1 (BBBD)) TaxID=630390 RepID=A0A180G4P6_PUCT1|nr:hypothetical protein PTTG_00736 [Puccinia triticina 1-1 BBBD Race 1]
MFPSTPSVQEYRESQLKLARCGSRLSASTSSSSSSSSSAPQIPFKPGHLRSISSQVRVQNRIIQAVEIRPNPSDPAGSRLSASPPPALLHHADQATIKASQRRPLRQTTNAIQKLWQTDNHPADPFLPRDWRGGVNGQSRTSGDPRLASLDSKHVATFQDLPIAGGKREEKLSLGVKPVKPLGSSPQTESVVHGTPGQASTFTPLTTPQQAIALYCFNPEAYDSSESGRDEEDDSEKMTPEVGFRSGDRLEIWVPDIGGGWSLGKNLTSSTSQSSVSLGQTTGNQVDDWGLIPIGWYKIVESPDTPRSRTKVKRASPIESSYVAIEAQPSQVCPSHNQTPLASAQVTRTDQEYLPISRQNPNTSSSSGSYVSDVEVYSLNEQRVQAEAGWTNALDAPPSTGKSSSSRSNIVTKLGATSSRSSGYLLSPPMLNASVAINREFDPNGVHFDYQARGIACSVTASDAMFAARQAADRHSFVPLASRGSSISHVKTSSWNPFFKNLAPNRRHSSAQSYIIGEEGYQQDLVREEEQDQGCTERYEIQAGPAWKDSTPRFTVRIHSPQLQTQPSKMKAYVIYSVTSTFSNEGGSADNGPANVQVTVARRYSHFGLLFIGLNSMYGEVIDLPTLPEKTFTSNCDDDFIEHRRRALERYLFRLTRHPVLRYCPRLTTFLGCDDVEEFEAEARTWSQSPPEQSQNPGAQPAESVASSSFFSKVFHPDYNVDEPEVESAIAAYNQYTQSLENSKSMIDLERNLSNLRTSIQGYAPGCLHLRSNYRSINRKIFGIFGPDGPPYAAGNDARGGYQRLEKGREGSTQDENILRDLRRDARDAGMQNYDGAMCWKEDCAECLAMTKALQLLGQSLGDVAGSYSTCAAEALAPVEALIKELSFPHKNRKHLSNLHDSTKVSFSDLNGHGTVDVFEARKETVLNVVMSEIERHHQERNTDFRDMAKSLLDGQIQLHQTACDQLKEARQALEEPQLSFLGRFGPRSMNAEEAQGLQRQHPTRSSSAIFASSHNESFKSARSQLDLTQSDDRPLTRSSSVLEWINRSAKYSGKLSENASTLTNPLPRHHRNPSIASHSSTIASSAFSSVFVKPLSAAFSSMVDFSDYLS